MTIKLKDSIIALPALTRAAAFVKYVFFAQVALAGSLLAAGPSAGSRRGDLGPDTIIYTKEQADQVFTKKGYDGGLPKYSPVAQTEAANAVTNAPGRTYAVQTNATGDVVVNVPWVEGGGTQPCEPPVYVVVTNPATLKCVYGTNIVPVPNGVTLTADLSGWVEGQTVFTKIVPAGTYAVATTVTLAGYGTWPTVPFDCVAWRSGDKVYITVLREEE